MSDAEDSVDTDDFAYVETLLREVTAEDSERLAPPDDIWASIAAEITPAESVAPVVTLASRRRFPQMALLGAAAAVVVAIAGVVVATRGSNDTAVLASADLAYDAAAFDPQGADATASVSLVESDGQFLIEIDEAALPNPDDGASDLEIWLIQPDADGNPADLVSLGYVDPDQPGEYAVPADYDPGEFFVVDISVEPRDGVETHSGRSILRGALVDA